MSTSVVQFQNQTPSLFPTDKEWAMIKEQATLLVKSKLLPTAIDTPEKAIAIALKGRELGIPLMQAFGHIHVVQGKPSISAELMLSLIYRNCHGAVVNYIETTDKSCEIEACRPGGKPAKFRFTWADAEKAKLTCKDSWKNYPAAMLRARTISIVARAMFPDAIMGCSYTPEELGAEVDDEGEVIDVPAEHVRSGQPEAASAPAAAAPKADEKSKTEEKPPVKKTKASLGLEILRVGGLLGISQEKIAEYAIEDFKKPTKDLSVDELQQFLDYLLGEAGRQGIEV